MDNIGKEVIFISRRKNAFKTIEKTLKASFTQTEVPWEKIAIYAD